MKARAMRLARIAGGLMLLAAGVAMLALPGPGWLTIAAGLALLSRDMAWARRLFDALKRATRSVGIAANEE